MHENNARCGNCFHCINQVVSFRQNFHFLLLYKFSTILLPSGFACRGLIVGKGKGDLQQRVKQLKRRKNDVVDVLNVVQTEQLFQVSEFVIRCHIAFFQNNVCALLCLLFGFQRYNRQNDCVRVKQQTESAENVGADAALIQQKEVKQGADDDQRNAEAEEVAEKIMENYK